MAIDWGNVAKRALLTAYAPAVGLPGLIYAHSRPLTRGTRRPTQRPAARNARGQRPPVEAPTVNDPSLRASVIAAAFNNEDPGVAAARTAAIAAPAAAARAARMNLQITTPYDTNPYNAAFDQQAAALRSQLSGLDAGYAQRRNALGGMFNFGEDPRARAALNQQIAALNQQRVQGLEGIGAAYQGGIDASNRASWLAMANGQETGRALAGLYNEGAAGIQAGNRQLAADTARGVGFLGVNGPIGGESVDVSAALTAAAPREQALAESLGKVNSDMQSWLASSMAQQRGAEQGQLTREVGARQAAAQQMFAQQEAARIAAERDAYRQAQLQLAAEQADRTAQVQAALAGTAGDRARADAERQFNREQYLADLRSLSAERAYAEQQAALERRRTLNDAYRTDRIAMITTFPPGAQRRSALRQLNRSQPRSVRTVPVGRRGARR